MKKYTSRKTGEVVYGTLKESTKTHKAMGYDWSLHLEGKKGRRRLYVSLIEFINSYEEEPNAIHLDMVKIARKFFEK